MRIFAYIVAILSLAACLGCLITIPKFQAFYHDMNAELPTLTKFVLTYGVLLATLFLLLAVALIVLAALDKPGIAAGMAGLTLLILLASGILVPVALMVPISNVVESIDDSSMERESPPEAP